MNLLETVPSPTPTRSPRRRAVAGWMLTFLGFPLGGFLADVLAGPVDSPRAAMIGGLITGSVLGATQAIVLRSLGVPVREWIAATAVGLLVGLGVGAAVVGYGTSLADLVAQGAICGLAVGVAQAVVLRRRDGLLALAWPPVLAVSWAIGWAVTTSAGIQVDDQFTVFGASGAIVVTALTAVLPLLAIRSTTAR